MLRAFPLHESRLIVGISTGCSGSQGAKRMKQLGLLRLAKASLQARMRPVVDILRYLPHAFVPHESNPLSRALRLGSSGEQLP